MLAEEVESPNHSAITLSAFGLTTRSRSLAQHNPLLAGLQVPGHMRLDKTRPRLYTFFLSIVHYFEAQRNNRIRYDGIDAKA
jgi:hypothetical protein